MSVRLKLRLVSQQALADLSLSKQMLHARQTAATLIATGKDASLIEREVISSKVWEQNALPSFQKPSPTLAVTLCLQINMAELSFSPQRCTARENKKVCDCSFQACVGGMGTFNSPAQVIQVHNKQDSGAVISAAVLAVQQSRSRNWSGLKTQQRKCYF